ncbi:hypothetical protein [Frigoribacterium sp. CFBP 13707]|uniref:hypothetical protein n=1 Tax=Frigoribacterium sp. CFBP 13707 TaxID=2775313 RepID=UPI00177B3AE9|nr:hypothetical protein [Frigoribacterium sp. CFBP 13707]MBD8728861.1 hypothetical protein [Frigoribacterium sp. CFBP 13707]
MNEHFPAAAPWLGARVLENARAWVVERSVDIEETDALAPELHVVSIIATAAQAESHSITAEVLSDAMGAISISDATGSVDAKTVQATLMALLHSNFAAVSTLAAWATALTTGEALPKENLPTSASTGAQHFIRA